MKIIYSDNIEIGKNKENKSVFLAGPTPRDDKTESWRPSAIELFKKYDFQGTIFVPECSDKKIIDYDAQVAWELENLTKCSIIMFWVASNNDTMLALTTRTEFGYWLGRNPQKVWYGRPDSSYKTTYLDHLFKYNKPEKTKIYNNLPSLIHAIIAARTN